MTNFNTELGYLRSKQCNHHRSKCNLKPGLEVEFLSLFLQFKQKIMKLKENWEFNIFSINNGLSSGVISRGIFDHRVYKSLEITISYFFSHACF